MSLLASITTNDMKTTLLVYGANGYTGRLIADLCATYGLQPLLAGRNEVALKEMGANLNLPYKVVGLNQPELLREVLTDVRVVIHAAGPFIHTALPMLEACLATNTHYLDITGEIAVFELAKTLNRKAENAGIMVMPGVGFDVVPTDCTALFLKNKLPDATHLQLAFVNSGGGISHGTASTMVEGLGQPGAVRENGVIVPKPIGHKSRWLTLDGKKYFVMTIPWGDVSTAYHTTGIPTIETYTGVKPIMHTMLKFQGLWNRLLRTDFVKKKIQTRVDRINGPDDEARTSGKSLIWGSVQNAAGQTYTALLQTPEGYTLTAHSSLIIAKKVLSGELKTGYQTPASAYGENLILEVPGTIRKDVFPA
jgi:short subunit dehydrogenase-like uncharacterized protein